MHINVCRGRRVYAPVRVKDSGKPWVWSFTNHIQPVLTKTGCNSGACHGASAGKGGLKLTLRGFDPELFAIFRMIFPELVGTAVEAGARAASDGLDFVVTLGGGDEWMIRTVHAMIGVVLGLLAVLAQ